MLFWNLILIQAESPYSRGRAWGNISCFLYNGKKIFLKANATRGWQESIFNDEIFGGFEIYIWRELGGQEKAYLEREYSHLKPDQMTELIKKLSHFHTGEMEPYYIMRYGFYEGHTDYRVDPIAISFIFGLRSLGNIEKAFKGNLFKELTDHFTKKNISSAKIK